MEVIDISGAFSTYIILSNEYEGTEFNSSIGSEAKPEEEVGSR